MKPRLVKVVLVFGSLTFALLAAEQTLRWLGWEYRPLTVQVRDREDARGFHLFEDDHFVYDPRLIWRPKADFGVFNAQGFRGPVIESERAPGEVRIFAIGDSNTLGWAGDDGANWPASLSERLASLGSPATVVNSGVWGYASSQGLVRLEEVLPFDPDLVLISFGSNDAHRVSSPDREYARGSLILRRLARWLTHYRVGQLVAAGLSKRSAGGAEQPRVPLDTYRENLVRMASMVRESGGEPVFLTRPFTGSIDDPRWWKNFAFDYNAVTVEVALEQQVLMVDLYSYFKGRDELFSDESHFTDEGHRLAADIVADHLAPFLNVLRKE